VPVLGRAGQQPGPAIGHGQVPVGRRDQDDPSGQRLTILGMPGRQRASAGQDVREHRGAGGRDVQYDQDRRREIFRQMGHEGPERLDAPADAATATAAGGRAVG